MEKLKRQLAEADAAVEAQKKPPAANNGPKVVGEGLVIDEWVRTPLLFNCLTKYDGCVIFLFYVHNQCSILLYTRKNGERNIWRSSKWKQWNQLCKAVL